MSKRKVLFIINPIAGVNENSKVLTLASKVLSNDEFEVSSVETEYAGHAEFIAKDASKSGFHIVVAVGGDGTINEIGRALLGTSTAMAIIPRGSGNGFARHIGLPIEIQKSIENIKTGHVLPVDVGLLNNRPFFNVSGIGFDAEISKSFDEAPSRGFWTYFQLVFRKIFSFKGVMLKLKSEVFEKEGQFFMVTFCNTNQFGNNAIIAPDASLLDGHIAITVINRFKFFEMFGLAMKFIKKQIHKSTKVDYFKIKQLSVISNKRIVAHIDGDPYTFDHEVEIRISQEKLNIISPLVNI